MRKSLKIIPALVILLTASGLPVLSRQINTAINKDLNASEAADHIVLTWTDDPQTTQTITWRAKTSVTGAVVMYRQSGMRNSRWLVKHADVENFSTVPTDTEGGVNIFSVTLAGLKSGTAYIYSIRSGSKSSPRYTFRTAHCGDEAFSFLVFGDSQSGEPGNPEYAPWHRTVTSAFRRTRNARFMVNVGDLVELGQSYIHWERWFRAARDVISSIPVVAVQGNHENYTTPEWECSMPVYFTRQFKMFRNGPAGMQGRVYSFDYGDAHLVVLNSQQEEESGIYGDILKAQEEWLDKDLARTGKTWKLVFFHKPPYYNYRLRSNEDIKTAFCPIFDKYHVDVVFTGHDHALSRTFPMRGGKMNSRPEEGTVYYIAGRSGAKTLPYMPSKLWNAFSHNPVGQPVYLVLDVQKSVLKINAFRQDGSVLDRYVIDKTGGNNGTETKAPARYPVTMAAVNGMVLPWPMEYVQAADGGHWFVNIVEFAASLGADIPGGTGNAAFTLGGEKYDIPVHKIRSTVGSASIVSADDIQAILGFSYRYDESMNVIFFEKPPKVSAKSIERGKAGIPGVR